MLLISSLFLHILCFRVFSYKLNYQKPHSPLLLSQVYPDNPGYVRRERYKGRYPKNYSQKYKEINGDETVVQKVLDKGGTPAGTHVSIMIDECISALDLANKNISRNLIVVDCTLGFGGHSKEIMKHIIPNGGRLICLDQDYFELLKTEVRLRDFVSGSVSSPEKREYANSLLNIYHQNFGNISEFLAEKNLTGKVTGLLADLGFSSMQIDNPIRGFTYKSPGPLDMRMVVIKLFPDPFLFF